MRNFAEGIIRAAAIEAGLPEAAVMAMQEGTKDILLPKPRLEIEWLPEDFRREGRKLARVAGSRPRTHEALRVARYRSTLTARCALTTKDADQLEALCRAFIMALPKVVGDPDGNLVTVEPQRAVRGGFGQKLVEIEKKLSSAIHVLVTSYVCEDLETPWITDVIVNPKYRRQADGQEG